MPTPRSLHFGSTESVFLFYNIPGSGRSSRWDLNLSLFLMNPGTYVRALIDVSLAGRVVDLRYRGAGVSGWYRPDESGRAGAAIGGNRVATSSGPAGVTDAREV